MTSTPRRWFRRGAIAGIALLLLLAVAPYLIPLQHADGEIAPRPFANSRFVEVDGLRLHLAEWPGASPRRSCPVLLVHGFAGSSFSFRQIGPVLARRGQDTYAVDLPGFGYSTRELAPAGDAALLWGLIDTLARDGERWCLIGHSLGARVVGEMAALDPERVAGVVYVSGSPITPAAERPLWQRALFALPPARRAATVYADRILLNEQRIGDMLGSAYGREPTADEIAAYLAPLRIEGTTEALIARNRRPPASPPLIATLRPIPTLILWGREDRWVPQQRGQVLARYLPAARLSVLEVAGHLPLETHATEALGEIGTWIDRLPRKQPPAAAGNP
jgi:pimeloyl-ACP methyl ester carboxylesterase